MEYLRCYAQVSLPAIGHNIDEVRKRLAPGVKLLAVIKADAYGHGACRVGKYLEPRVNYFAVATLEEAVELREGGITRPILILSYVSPSQYPELVRYEITQTIDSLDQAEALEQAAAQAGKRAKIHIGVDTGMTRIGFQVREDEADRIAQIAGLPHLEMEGIFTHFSCADQEDKSYCRMQLDKFERMYRYLEERKVNIPIRHICNSAGIMEFDRYRFDMVRSGIITYGMYPSEEVMKERLDLIPALEWKAHVIHVKDVEAGVSVGYGATFTTSRSVTRIATVSVGYADGYPRALSGRGSVLIHGKYAPILGRVCMDQMMVDVTGIPDIHEGDEAILWGGSVSDTAETIARKTDTISYEVLCGVSRRVPRVYLEHGKIVDVEDWILEA